MIAMQLTTPGLSSREAPRCSTAAPGESDRHGILPAGDHATVVSQFQPLDPRILGEAIPAFFISRNKEGFWVARDVKGRIGGLFVFKNSALFFAKSNSPPTGCATIHPWHRFELDLENRGNALVPHLRSLKRLAIRALQRMAVLIGGSLGALPKNLK